MILDRQLAHVPEIARWLMVLYVPDTDLQPRIERALPELRIGLED